MNGVMRFTEAMIIAFIAFAISAEGHERHNKNTSNTAVLSIKEDTVAESTSVSSVSDQDTHSISEFPTYHPLVVHFPIVLIIIAAVFQLVSLVVFRSEMSWAVLFLSLFGAIGAYLASNVFHPHTTALVENAQRLLAEHEFYADMTFWLAAAGFFAKVFSNFVFKRRWWSETVVTALLIGSAIAVSLAGHHGAELVHKEGVGPKGAFLETHDH